MSKAEKAALKAYPEPTLERITTDVYADARKCYVEGYEQAQKDLALTKEDVLTIFNLVRELQAKYSAIDGCLQEVADIFNEQRKK